MIKSVVIPFLFAGVLVLSTACFPFTGESAERLAEYRQAQTTLDMIETRQAQNSQAAAVQQQSAQTNAAPPTVTDEDQPAAQTSGTLSPGGGLILIGTLALCLAPMILGALVALTLLWTHITDRNLTHDNADLDRQLEAFTRDTDPVRPRNRRYR